MPNQLRHVAGAKVSWPLVGFILFLVAVWILTGHHT
jgi:hypothetical protein